MESLNWTAQPTNPTQAIKGKAVSLTWDYSLTADEQSKNQYVIIWNRLNDESSSGYDQIGSVTFFVVRDNPQTLFDDDPPHIVINKNDPATLHINDVRREDEGKYKIEFFLEFGVDAKIIADHEVNLTVLGKF
ncbi:hypothetical protein OS493_032393 [Desmophyllum pertusum]|uniref:Uncharacterized protein n=1 Tax=Desmophyllum pertusum TaxID=174260 RepID=A0A9W9Y871_9CNID|nr:hypothetical protein OS493_032393 [Desmophyllum pertusum]